MEGYELVRQVFGINFGVEMKAKADPKGPPVGVVNGTSTPSPGQKKPRRR